MLAGISEVLGLGISKHYVYMARVDCLENYQEEEQVKTQKEVKRRNYKLFLDIEIDPLGYLG